MSISSIFAAIKTPIVSIFKTAGANAIADISKQAGLAAKELISEFRNRFSVERISFDVAVNFDSEQKELADTTLNLGLDELLNGLDTMSGVIPLSYDPPLRCTIDSDGVARIKQVVKEERNRTKAAYDAKELARRATDARS